jgi:hypothetical protein
MANCNILFQEYNREIKLDDVKRTELINVRNNLRTRVREGYSIVTKVFNHQHRLEFNSQGSFVMDTLIKPTREDYDLDDGIYFIGSMIEEQRPLPEEFHDWVKRSIDRGYDDIETITDKATCVRVAYKKGFHVDLPIYYSENFESPYLANKEQGWILSNPIEFIAWFEDKIKSGFQKGFLYETRMFAEYEKWSADIRKTDHQLRRIVRYLKSWGDLRREEMPCGLIMTILAANHYSPNDRDDIALKETLVNIYSSLTKDFRCKRPTTPIGEDILKSYKNKDAFLNYLFQFLENGKKALEEENHKKACIHWQKSLGDRFPCDLAKDGPTIKIASAGLISGAATSRPWC